MAELLPLKPSFAAPKHLSPTSKALFLRLARDYGLQGDEHALLVLTSAFEARDRGVRARKVLDREGETISDRYGSKKLHPMVTVEHDSHGRMLASFKALRLDVEISIPGKPGRKGR